VGRKADLYSDRNCAILHARTPGGRTFADIGREFSLSGRRVSQICWTFVDDGFVGGEEVERGCSWEDTLPDEIRIDYYHQMSKDND
jgi:hypothetical protein